MSERKVKKARRREAQQLEQTTGKRKLTSILRRRRLTFLALAAGFMILAVSLYNNAREARVTIMNRTGVPLKGIKIDYAEGSKSVDSIEAGEKLSVPLVAQHPAPANWPKGKVSIEFHREDGATIKLSSFAGASDPKLHQVFNAVNLPDGQLNLMPVPEDGGENISLRGLLRSIGIGR